MKQACGSSSSKAGRPALPVDVQDPNEGVLFARELQRLVNPLHNEIKEVGVDLFGQGVTGVEGLGFGHGLDDGLGGSHDPSVAQPPFHFGTFYLQQSTKYVKVLIIQLGKRRRKKKK